MAKYYSAVDVIRALGGTEAVSAAIGVTEHTVKSWVQRGHVPGSSHAAVIRLAEARGVPWITATLLDELTEAASQKAPAADV